jgi:hypothetical protein
MNVMAGGRVLDTAPVVIKKTEPVIQEEIKVSSDSKTPTQKQKEK